MNFKKARKCSSCGLGEPDVAFGTRMESGRLHNQSCCKKCEAARGRAAFAAMSGTEKSALFSRVAARERKRRAEPTNTCLYILKDSRAADRKAKYGNDLDREFVREAIKDGCSYCGETELRMTLDRIDNDLGHLKSNVVPACIRCNYTRKDMPHEAWLLVAKGMRAARKAGFFGKWTGRGRTSDASKE